MNMYLRLYDITDIVFLKNSECFHNIFRNILKEDKINEEGICNDSGVVFAYLFVRL